MPVGNVCPLVALTVALGGNFVISSYSAMANARSFAAQHDQELSGDAPRSVIYSEGIPDGGTAIIRLPGKNPVELPQRTMVDLTGERFKSCKKLDKQDWYCRFD